VKHSITKSDVYQCHNTTTTTTSTSIATTGFVDDKFRHLKKLVKTFKVLHYIETYFF